MQAEHLGNTYLEIAKVYNKAKDLEKAIEYQNKAYETYCQLEKYADSDYLAEIVMNLSEF